MPLRLQIDSIRFNAPASMSRIGVRTLRPPACEQYSRNGFPFSSRVVLAGDVQAVGNFLDMGDGLAGDADSHMVSLLWIV